MIKMSFIGNLGKDAELRSVTGSGMVINFTVGINTSYTKAGGEKVESTQWVDCALWKPDGQSTKIAEYLKKGIKVYIEGTPGVNAYLKDDIAKAGLTCRVQTTELLGSKTDSAAGGNNDAGSQGSPVATGEPEDKLPF